MLPVDAFLDAAEVLVLAEETGTFSPAAGVSRLAIARLSTLLLLPPVRAELSFELGDPKLKLLRIPAVVLGRLLLGLVRRELPESRLEDRPPGPIVAEAESLFFAALATSWIFLMSLRRSSQDLMSGPPKTRLPSTCANTKVAPRLRYTATPSARPELPSGIPVSSSACSPKPRPEPSKPSITGAGG